MRDDMDKVIVERPRSGRNWPSKGHIRCWQRVPAEELPLRELRPAKFRTKGLNENLAPLRRFLEKSVGRPWNKVHAELAAHIDRGNAVQAHIWQHIEDFVCLHAVVDEAGVGRRIGRGYGVPLLYVDPRTGILRRNPDGARRWRRSHATPLFDIRRSADGDDLLAVAGVWYEVTFAAWPGRFPRWEPPVGFDVVLRKPLAELDEWTLRAHYRRAVYVTHKRQLASKEIERLGLRDRGWPLPSFTRNRRRRRRRR